MINHYLESPRELNLLFSTANILAQRTWGSSCYKDLSCAVTLMRQDELGMLTILQSWDSCMNTSPQPMWASMWPQLDRRLLQELLALPSWWLRPSQGPFEAGNLGAARSFQFTLLTVIFSVSWLRAHLCRIKQTSRLIYLYLYDLKGNMETLLLKWILHNYATGCMLSIGTAKKP